MLDLVLLRSLLTASVRMRHFSGRLLLQDVSASQQNSKNDKENVEEPVKTEVGGETMLVARRVGLLEDLERVSCGLRTGKGQAYLRGSHVASSPSNKGNGQSSRLLGLAGNVARNEREDQIAFSKVELGAVEGNEQAHTVGMVWWDAVDDCRSDDSRTKTRCQSQIERELGCK
jgi:hypothetical protein